MDSFFDDAALPEFSPEDCEDAIYSNDYADYIINFAGGVENILPSYNAACIQIVGRRFAVVNERIEGDVMTGIGRHGYSVIPKCFGLTDTSSLEEAGVLRLRRQPYLNLLGSGVLVAFIDTGERVIIMSS